ncbi:TPA: helix-turn-helix domain-containing protein [Pseudomonas aeruginosa]
MRHRANPELGSPAKHKPGQWVQTERKAHEAWAHLIARKPRAAELLHHLVAQMGHQNAVVVSQKTLAQITGRSVETVKRALRDLVAERWVSVVKLNGPGTVNAYVVNDRVAWGQRRDQLCLSVFSATVVADRDDQDEALLGHADLRRIPTLYPGERQLPTGPGEEPPSQPDIPGMEPDLPALTETEEWERRGQQRLPMPDEPCFLDDGEPLEPPTRVTLPRR